MLKVLCKFSINIVIVQALKAFIKSLSPVTISPISWAFHEMAKHFTQLTNVLITQIDCKTKSNILHSLIPCS